MDIPSKFQMELYQEYISKGVFQHLSEGIGAFQKADYFSASVWGAVFLEAFLAEWMDRFNIKISSKNDDLYSRIQRIESNTGTPGDITDRCHEIRTKRNRLVHDKGLKKTTIKEDARTIYINLREILQWYCEKASPISNEEKDKKEEKTINEKALLPVFISTLNPDNEKQRFFISGFKDRLKKIGIKPVSCEFNFYDGKDPLLKVRNEISKCNAVIVLGLERSNAYYIKDKEGSKKENVETHRKYTSGWLHLEAGIANALGKEVFVLCQHDIYSDGVFDRNWNTYPVMEFTELDEYSREFTMFFDYLTAWVKVNKNTKAFEEKNLVNEI